MSEIRFDGRVALVTGAGKGLGRAYAKLLAARGATVIVNNRKREPQGEKGSADLLVDEIAADGGTAVANYESVETWEAGQAMVAQALDSFGRLDILVNNAGVDQHTPLHRSEIEDFERVFNINFYGSVYVTRAVLPHMREAGYGRILFSSSSVGMYGLHGLTAYSAAKAALYGFMRAVAQENARKGVTAHAIAPYALTPMTEGNIQHFPESPGTPEEVAPLVAWLMSEDCTDTGKLIVAGAGHFAAGHMVQGLGVTVDRARLSPETVREAWAGMQGMDETVTYADGMVSFIEMMERIKV